MFANNFVFSNLVFFFSPYFSSPTSGKIMVLPLSYWKQTRVNSFNERPSFFNLVLLPKCSDFEFFWYYSLFFTTLISFLSFWWRICRHINDSLQNRNQGTFRAVVVFTEWGVIIAVTSLLYYKTVRIFAYSSTREQSNKRSGTRLKTESQTGERRYGRVRLARFARVRLLRHALPISLLILRKKTDCFAVY